MCHLPNPASIGPIRECVQKALTFNTLRNLSWLVSGGVLLQKTATLALAVASAAGRNRGLPILKWLNLASLKFKDIFSGQFVTMCDVHCDQMWAGERSKPSQTLATTLAASALCWTNVCPAVLFARMSNCACIATEQKTLYNPHQYATCRQV